MIFIDTSYLIAIANQRDSLHKSAAAQSQTLDARFVTTDLVVVEFVNALSRESLRAKAHKVVASMLLSGRIEVVQVGYSRLLVALNRHSSHNDKEWSLTDCVSFDVMHELNITKALTHDHHFVQAGFEALLRSEP